MSMSIAEMNWAEVYEKGETPWNSGRVSTELQKVAAEFAIAPCRALEIGCGCGTNAIWLAQQGFDVTAFDLAPPAIERARRAASRAGVKINIFVGDALALPDLGGPFDFIFDRGVYHHLRLTRLSAFLRTLTRFCSRNGHYLTLAGNANEHMPNEMGPPRATAFEIVSELGAAFELIQLREFRFDTARTGGEFHPLAWSAFWRRQQ